MKKEDEYRTSFENSITATKASIRKAHIISDIIEKAEQGDEEENKGRS